MSCTRVIDDLPRWAAACAILLATLPAAGQVSPELCGPLENAYGPYDYQTDRARLGIVEKFHFTSQVETLVRGSSGTLGGDLDYTLRASPNHHRALIALIRLSERTRLPQPAGLPRQVECYFERALRFRRDDNVARMLYARYLAVFKREAEAIQQVDRVVQAAGDRALTHYNAGLIYVELKAYDKALAQAHEARRLGYGATGLQEQLAAVNRWRAPPESAASAPAPSAAASAASSSSQ